MDHPETPRTSGFVTSTSQNAAPFGRGNRRRSPRSDGQASNRDWIPPADRGEFIECRSRTPGAGRVDQIPFRRRPRAPWHTHDRWPTCSRSVCHRGHLDGVSALQDPRSPHDVQDDLQARPAGAWGRRPLATRPREESSPRSGQVFDVLRRMNDFDLCLIGRPCADVMSRCGSTWMRLDPRSER